MDNWKTRQIETLHSHKIFDLERRELMVDDRHRDVLVVAAPDWINVIPLLDDGRVVLIRQWRFGIEAPTLEIPGGMVDPGEDARTAASRELEEETGYRAAKLDPLGFTHPNPAFLTNRLTTWLATDLTPTDCERKTFGVEGEEIQRELVPLERIPSLIREGQISHSLVVAAFHLFHLDRELVRNSAYVER